MCVCVGELSVDLLCVLCLYVCMYICEVCARVQEMETETGRGIVYVSLKGLICICILI